MATLPTITSHADSVRSYLATIPGMAFRAPGDLVQFEANVTIDTALDAMNAADVSGAPVYDGTPFYEQLTDTDAGGFAASVAASGKDYIGIVDVADLASLILDRGLKRKAGTGIFARIGDMFTIDEEHSVKSAINRNTTHRFYALPLTGNLEQAAIVIARKRVHRIAIINPEKDNHIEGMVTGTSVITALRDNLPVLGALGTVPVGFLFPTEAETMVTASATTATARDCLNSLLQHNLLGMPLVDTDGAIVGNFSLSDIKSLAGLSTSEAEAALSQPASELGKSKPRQPLTVTPSDTLTAVIELLATTQVHRVYIVDPARRPIGAITVTDVIRLVLSPTLTGYPGPAEAPIEAGVPRELSTMLSTVTAADFLARDGVRMDKLVDVPYDMNAMGVLRVLADHNLSGVPVYQQVDEVVPDLVSFVPYAYPAEKKYVGWVDAGDLCGLLLDKGLRARSEGFFGLLSSLYKDEERSSSAAMNYSNNDPFWAIPATRNMGQVIRVLGNCKVHRLAVVDADESNNIVGVITQSAVIKYIAEHRALLGGLASQTVSSFLKPSPLIKIPVTATVADALRQLVACKITGLPVVDDVDNIVANISVTDIRHLARVPVDDVDRVLALPVLAFLSEVKAAADPRVPIPSLAPAVLHPSDTLGLAVDLLATSGIHRLYIVEAGSPVGVVTLTDIIKAVAASF